MKLLFQYLLLATALLSSALSSPTASASVGFRFFEWTDASRVDIDNSGKPRRIVVWVFYPTKVSAVAASPLLPTKWRDSHFKEIESRFGEGAAATLINANVAGLQDAPLLENPHGYPVVVFSPGAGLLPTDFMTLLSRLCTGGYVVIAVASPGASGLMHFSDGGSAKPRQPSEHVYKEVAADLGFVFHQIAQVDSKGGDFLRGRLDLQRVGMLGHSLGGAAAFMATAKSPAVRAAINLDGDFLSPPESKPAQPLLYVTSEPQTQTNPFLAWRDRSEKRRRESWRKFSAHSSSAHHIRIEGTLHFNFLDAAGLPIGAIPEVSRAGRLGAIAGKRGLDVSSSLVLGFLDKHLREKQDAWDKALKASREATSKVD